MGKRKYMPFSMEAKMFPIVFQYVMLKLVHDTGYEKTYPDELVTYSQTEA